MNTMKLRLILSLLIVAAVGCNTTKTDQRADQSAPASTSSNGTASATSTQERAVAPPGASGVGAVSSVSPAGAEMAADFAWSDASGAHKLSDYRGKVVLINFWGTWCPPCRRELPSLVKIRQDLGSEKFEIIGINVGEQPRDGSSVEQHVAKFASANNIGWPLVIADESIVNAYGGIEVVPTTFIVDGSGKIVERIQGSRDEAGFRALIEKAM
jgi:thiol-disulfide isomerase/thioredoxin